MEEVNRVKALLVHDNQIMLCFCNNQYQFPGGHVEENEDFLDALKREIKEETGIVIETKGLIPFHKITYNLKEGNSNIYYYAIECNKKINIKKTTYTESEIKGGFKVLYIDLLDVEQLLINNINAHPKNKYIVPEMLEALKVYKKQD